jgi:hypothetical protein
LGYSKKGYIEGEISVEWIKDFDLKTRAKAAGRCRLLLLDGHASHYTLAFLRYAKANHIEVLCYPSHSTHVYQGLDIVIFASFKRNWSEVRDRWECEGRVVDKTTFLAVYAEAHFKTLTPENIKAAFKATGVIPLNRDVVTEEMMAPSIESSSRGTLPVQQASPVKFMSNMIVDYMDYQKLHTVGAHNDAPHSDPADSLPTEPGPATPLPPATPFFARSAIESLSRTSAAFLTRTSPLKSTSLPPIFKLVTISPQRPVSRYAELLARPPASAREQELRDALAESDLRDETRKGAMIQMQAGVVLAGMYVNRAQGQLQAAEERKGKNKSWWKMGDGKAKWFTSDAFIQMCVDDEKRKEDEEKGKEGRQVAQEAHAAELAEWKKQNNLIHGRNEAKKQVFEADKAAWELEKAEAKADKRRPAWPKPKWKDYEAELLLPRPKKAVEDEDEDSDDGNGSGHGSGMDED